MQYNIITSALFCLVEKPVEEITFENYEIPQEFRSQLKLFYKGIFKLENFGSKYPVLFVFNMSNDSEVSNITYMYYVFQIIDQHIMLVAPASNSLEALKC